MAKKNILLLCGGGGTEHEISLISAQFIKEQLDTINKYQVYQVEIEKDGTRRDLDGNVCELRKSGELAYPDKTIQLDFAIPCIHGPPGETGDIQSVFELMGLPYMGPGPEASTLCFNKVSTKLWFDALDIPNTPYYFLYSNNEQQINKATSFFNEHGGAFIKAASQGSSVGCYHVTDSKKLVDYINQAFELSPYVLLERPLKGRELEIAAYEYNGKLEVTPPGEIVCPDGFYTYEEKYSKESHTETKVKAEGLTKDQINKMRELAQKAFLGMKLKHLSRIDFFLTDENEIFLNEINTFPGHTSISMFPMMMKANGHEYTKYLEYLIEDATKE